MAWKFINERQVYEWPETYKGYKLRMSTPTEWKVRWVGAIKNGNVVSWTKFPIASHLIDDPAVVRELRRMIDLYDVAEA